MASSVRVRSWRPDDIHAGECLALNVGKRCFFLHPGAQTCVNYRVFGQELELPSYLG